MRDYPNRFLDNSYAEDINVYGIEGISQYLVITANSEYSFTRIEDARGFAAQLAAKREMLKTASLDRPRHTALIKEVRAAGARIKLISDGDMMPAISAALQGTGIHAVMGIGGAPEAVLTAAAVKCLGGEIQARIKWRNEEEKRRALEMGIDLSEDKVYLTEALAPGDEIVFAACGITTGDILKGVSYFGTGARTHSLIMTYQSGFVRFVDSIHVNRENRGPIQM